MGQQPDISKVPFGWATDPNMRANDDDIWKEKTFQGAYKYLQDRNNTDLQPLWDELNGANFTDADIKELWDYFDTKSRQQQGVNPANPTIRNSTEVRQFAGLGG
jgi:hypothetical protein